MDELLLKAQELTPIHEYFGVLYKRDDLFKPFSGEELNGGKVRQAINLISSKLEIIKSKYKSKVATLGSVNSPQGLIITRVAAHYNLKTFVAYGNISEKEMFQNNFIQHIRNFGGEVRSILGIAFDNRLMPKLLELQQDGSGNNFLPIKFGIDIEENPSGIDCISDQVQNLPDLDNLVIPAGSGISAGAILMGVMKFGKRIKNIHVVHVSGKDRQDKINEIAPNTEYKYYADKTYYPHSKKVKSMVSNGFFLDEIYEAKTYRWMIENIDYRNEKTLFWVVGNANYYR